MNNGSFYLFDDIDIKAIKVQPKKRYRKKNKSKNIILNYTFNDENFEEEPGIVLANIGSIRKTLPVLTIEQQEVLKMHLG